MNWSDIRDFLSTPQCSYSFEPITLTRKTIGLVVVLALIAVAISSALTKDQQFVFIPAALISVLSAGFLCEVWCRAKSFPFFEFGVFIVGTTWLYSCFPLFQHLFSGLHFTLLSDFRLMVNNPSAEEFGGFAWNHVCYVVPLVLSYLVVRGRPQQPRQEVRVPGQRFLWAGIVLYVGLEVWFEILAVVFGYNHNDTYRNYAALAKAKANMPYLLVQISDQLRDFTVFLETFLLIYLIRNWKQPAYRYAVLGWTLVKIASIVIAMGDRSPMALFVVSIILLYDRLIKPVNGALVLGFLATMMIGLLGYGFARDILYSGKAGSATVLSTTNEFFGLYSTSFDVSTRLHAGTMDHPPLAIFFQDFIALLPQQLVPIQKVDRGIWYVTQLGLASTGKGYMWGVITSGIAGFGKVDLALRGLLTGYVSAKVHRWYCHHGSDWKATVLYVILCLQAYYIFRADTFGELQFVEYGFVAPLIALFWVAHLLKGRTPKASQLEAAA